MRPLILFCVLFACCLFASPAAAQCSGGVCGLAGRPVLRAAAAPVRAVRFLRANKPVRSAIARVQPVRRVARGAGWLFGR